MPKIIAVVARQILDSRGNPTLEVEVTTSSKIKGIGLVPSGASKGDLEALELRDGDSNYYQGNGVLKAIENVNRVIQPALIGLSVLEQAKLDEIMIKLDGTKNKSHLGANAILGVSLAVAHAGSNYYQMPLYQYLGGNQATLLPRPMVNIINGGAHANNGLDFQEYMIVPLKANNIKQAIQMAQNVFYHLKVLLKSQNMATGVGDEGGFAPSFSDNEKPLELIIQAIRLGGYTIDQIGIALDVAASEFYDSKDGKYLVANQKLTSKELIEYYQQLIEKYPIISIEDGMAQDDYVGWKQISELLNNRIQLVGDDLFVTNIEQLSKGIKMGLANSILIKVNQIGTLSETIKTIKYALEHNYKCVISHRSGETNDTTIADLAVAFNTGQIKTGSMSRGERVVKYNRLMKIEELLGDKAKYN